MPCGGHLELVFEALKDSEELSQILQLVKQRARVARTITLDTHATTVDQVGRDVDFHFDDKSLRKVFGPGWRMLLIGGGQLSRFVASFALALDYEVIVCEPREEYSSSWSVAGCELTSQLPEDAVLSYATDPQSVVLALTHDPNLDDSALIEALPSASFYVGALGSKGNNDRRRKRLVGIGLEQHEVDRLHGPVGLNIGSRSAAEIAIAIIGELIKERNNADRLLRAQAGQ